MSSSKSKAELKKEVRIQQIQEKWECSREYAEKIQRGGDPAINPTQRGYHG